MPVNMPHFALKRMHLTQVEAVQALLDQERRTACEKENRYELEINMLRSQLKEMQVRSTCFIVSTVSKKMSLRLYYITKPTPVGHH